MSKIQQSKNSDGAEQIRGIFAELCRRYRAASGSTAAVLEVSDLVVPAWHGPLGSALEGHLSLHGLHHQVVAVDGVRFVVPNREVDHFVAEVRAAQPNAKIEKLEKLNL